MKMDDGFWLHETIVGVAFLWPGIGKEQMDAGGAIGWEQIAEGVTAFHAKHADVRQPAPRRLAADFLDPAQEAFDAQEIAFREMRVLFICFLKIFGVLFSTFSVSISSF